MEDTFNTQNNTADSGPQNPITEENWTHPLPVPGVSPSPIADDYPIADPLNANDEGIYDGADPADEIDNDGLAEGIDRSSLSGDDMDPVESGHRWNRDEDRAEEDVTILSGPDVLHGER